MNQQTFAFINDFNTRSSAKLFSDNLDPSSGFDVHALKLKSRQMSAEVKEPWTEREEFDIIAAHRRYKNRWSEMHTLLKGRTNNTIKNKFYSIFRRVKGKIVKMDCNFNSKLDLLQIFYILSLIDQYMEEIAELPKGKAKRGKDYIYSLIHNLSKKAVMDFKKGLKEAAVNEGTMEDLLQELSAYPKTIYENISDSTNHKKIEGQENFPAMINEEVPMEGETITRYSKKIDDVELFAEYPKLTAIDDSFTLGIDMMPPPVLLSPPILSAGPSAIVARAFEAPCFREPFSGFTDFSEAVADLFGGQRPKTSEDNYFPANYGEIILQESYNRKCW